MDDLPVCLGIILLKVHSLCRYYKVCMFLCVYMSTSEVGGKQDYSPVSWREYFEQMEDVNVGPADSGDVFRIYKAGSDGPLLVLLHGGGHSALSWAVFTVSICTGVWTTDWSIDWWRLHPEYHQHDFFLCCRQPLPAEWPAGYLPWISGVTVRHYKEKLVLVIYWVKVSSSATKHIYKLGGLLRDGLPALTSHSFHQSGFRGSVSNMCAHIFSYSLTSVEHFDLYYDENLFYVKVPPWFANQTTSQLKLCPGNSTRHTHANKNMNFHPPLILYLKLIPTRWKWKRVVLILFLQILSMFIQPGYYTPKNCHSNKLYYYHICYKCCYYHSSDGTVTMCYYHCLLHPPQRCSQCDSSLLWWDSSPHHPDWPRCWRGDRSAYSQQHAATDHCGPGGYRRRGG